MAISPLELRMQIRSTAAFIYADQVLIQPVRYAKVSDGAGGFMFAASQILAEEVVRLNPRQNDTQEGIQVSTSDGRRVVPAYTLLALPSTELERFDRFAWKGKVWELATAIREPEYIFKSDVVLFGE